MKSFNYKGWLIRQVIYPLLAYPVPARYGNDEVASYTDLKTVTQIEMIWTEYPYPSQTDIIDGVYRVREVFFTEPSVIVAGFPTKFQGIDIR